jgi:ABC-type amino acid transport substrate-binding protein
MRTGVIRCGYISYPPYLIKDANTGAMSGLSYEYMVALAREMGVKVEWAEEVGWGNFYEGLDTNRYDMFCVPVWQSGQRASIALLSRTVYFNSLYAFARADDNRFDSGFEAVNHETVSVTAVDSDITMAIANQKFPNARKLAVPQNADGAAMITNVATRKADILLDNYDNVIRYNQNAQVKLKAIADGKPVRLFGNVYALKKGELQFKAALDASIETINTDGTASAILSKYKQNFIPIAAGYDTDWK